MKVLLTGSTGFLGRNIKFLLERFGHEIICPRSSALLPNWDMLDLSSIEEIFSEHSPDVIVHSAWGVNEENYRESEFNLKWQAATLKLYTLAAEHNVGHFIALGTFSETGQDIFSGESRDRSVYAETKRQTLSNLIELESQLKLPVSWLRVNYPYGFWDKRNRLISVLIEKSISKEEFHLKSPDLKLDFTHSLDIANAVRVVIEKKIRGTLEVKSDESHSLSEVQGKIRTLLLNEMTHGNDIDALMNCISVDTGEEMWKALIPFDVGLSATIMNILESKANN
jgi:nucleoside-diphosphate-sugar epimerase